MSQEFDALEEMIESTESSDTRTASERSRDEVTSTVDFVHRTKSADDFVGEARSNRQERIAEAPEIFTDGLDPYYIDAANRAMSDRKVTAEDDQFKAGLAAFGQRSAVPYWNPL